MEKDEVTFFKSKYVKLVKDTGEVLKGTITDVLDDSVIFQTELARSAFSMKSIKKITAFEESRRNISTSDDVKI